MKKILWLIVAVLISAPLSAVASQNIRVAIADNLKTVTLRSSAGLMIQGVSPGAGVKILTFDAAEIGTKAVRIRSVGELTLVNGKGYRGWMELRTNRSGLLTVINDLDIEEYLNGVIPSEVPHGWELEALKAQAVAARTYALYQKRKAGSRHYHMLATVSSQVYNGGGGERKNARRAVSETKGIVIAYEGRIIPAFYHASCGGHTEDGSLLWKIDAPYLKGVDCECQEIIPNGLWEKRFSTAVVSDALKRAGYRVGNIFDMQMETITPSGRVSRVSVRSGDGVVTASGEALRQALGTTAIPSTFFELEVADGEVVFSGRGNGHGVGLCQWGAKEMAERGHDYISILSHYYPGTRLVRLD